MPSGTAFVDEASGELLGAYDPTVKWQLQVVSRQLLGAGHRLRICHRHRRPDYALVEVRQGESYPYFAGLQACGLLWVCPVCAAKVQAVRAGELGDALAIWADHEGRSELATLTVPHGRNDTPRRLVDQLTRAYGKMIASRRYKDWAEASDLVGTVRGLEVTWGFVHGWHPHLHVLQLADAAGAGGRGSSATAPGPRHRAPAVDPKRAVELFEMWHHSILRHTDLDAPSRKAFRLQDATHAARYVTKMGKEYSWGAEDELVRSHTKRGRGVNLTPFDILRAAAEGRDGPWGPLWRAYEEAFKGRRQLVWSDGLRALLGTPDERSDQEVADSIGQLDPVLATITPDEWRRIRNGNHQATVLQVVALHGAEGLAHLLGALEGDAHG
jgi:hypothetical protein